MLRSVDRPETCRVHKKGGLAEDTCITFFRFQQPALHFKVYPTNYIICRWRSVSLMCFISRRCRAESVFPIPENVVVHICYRSFLHCRTKNLWRCSIGLARGLLLSLVSNAENETLNECILFLIEATRAVIDVLQFLEIRCRHI